MNSNWKNTISAVNDPFQSVKLLTICWKNKIESEEKQNHQQHFFCACDHYSSWLELIKASYNMMLYALDYEELPKFTKQVDS